MMYSLGRRLNIAMILFMFISIYSYGMESSDISITENNPVTCQAKINAANDENCAGDVNKPFIILETSTAALGGFEIIKWEYYFTETVYVTFKGETDTITNGTFSTIEDHNTIQVVFLSSGPKKITLKITSTDSPGNGDICEDETSIFVTVLPNPNVSFVIDNSNVCIGDSMDVSFTFPGGVDFEEFKVKLEVNGQIKLPTLLDGDIQTYLISADTMHVQILNVLSDSTGCDQEFDEHELEQYLYASPSPALELADDLNLCIGVEGELGVEGADNYIWSPGNNLDNPTIANPTFTGDEAGEFTYVVTGTDSSGCKSIDSMNVVVLTPPGGAELDRLNSTCGSVCNIILKLENGGGNTIQWNVAQNGFNGTVFGENDDNYIIDLSGESSLPEKLDIQVRIVNGQGCTTDTTHTIPLNNTQIQCATIEQRPCDKRLVLMNDFTCFSWGYIDYENDTIIYNYSASKFLFDDRIEEGNRDYFVEAFNCNDPECKNVTIFRSKEELDDCYTIDSYAVIPNPNDGNFAIDFESKSTGRHELYIYDNIGRIQYVEEFWKETSKFSTSIQLLNIHTGVYHCKIVSETGQSWNFNILVAD